MTAEVDILVLLGAAIVAMFALFMATAIRLDKLDKRITALERPTTSTTDVG